MSKQPRVVAKLLSATRGQRQDITKNLAAAKKEHAKKIETLLKMREISVKVGVVGERAQEKQTDGGDLTMAQLASIHEYGLGTVPARPFLKLGTKPHKAEYAAAIREALRASKSSKKGLPDFQKFKAMAAKVGAMAVSDIRNFVRRTGVPPPLSEDRLEYKKVRKKSLLPLIFTGQLIRAIDYVVTKKRGKI